MAGAISESEMRRRTEERRTVGAVSAVGGRRRDESVHARCRRVHAGDHRQRRASFPHLSSLRIGVTMVRAPRPVSDVFRQINLRVGIRCRFIGFLCFYGLIMPRVQQNVTGPTVLTSIEQTQ